MRLWTIHPCYLDPKGLVALWRETLLAQNVLLGKTKGYKNHPQLIRFKKCKDPIAAIGAYLLIIYKEAESRGYNFSKYKIVNPLDYNAIDCELEPIIVSEGQILYEFKFLLEKLKSRSPEIWEKTKKRPDIIRLFDIIRPDYSNKNTEPWEKI